MNIKNELIKFRSGYMQVEATNFDEYLRADDKDLTAFGFWYLTPRFMKMCRPIHYTDGLKFCSSFDEVYDYQKCRWPIQYFFRHFLWDNLRSFWKRRVMGYYGSYWYHNQIARFFNDRYKWLRKLIPYTHNCLEMIYRNLCFAIVTRAVEKDKILESMRWVESDLSEVEDYFKRAHHIIRKELPETKERLAEALKKSHDRIKEAHEKGIPERVQYRYIYSEAEAIDTEIELLEAEVIEGLAKNYKFLWM